MRCSFYCVVFLFAMMHPRPYFHPVLRFYSLFYFFFPSLTFPCQGKIYYFHFQLYLRLRLHLQHRLQHLHCEHYQRWHRYGDEWMTRLEAGETVGGGKKIVIYGWVSGVVLVWLFCSRIRYLVQRCPFTPVTTNQVNVIVSWHPVSLT